MIFLPFLLEASALPDFNARHVPDEIPVAIRGAWDESLAACEESLSTTRIHIGANWIGFFESSGVLQIAAHAGIPDYAKSQAFRFVMAGEGSTWDLELVFAWNGVRPSEITWVEAKSPENSNQPRRRWSLVRCEGLQ